MTVRLLIAISIRSVALADERRGTDLGDRPWVSRLCSLHATGRPATNRRDEISWISYERSANVLHGATEVVADTGMQHCPVTSLRGTEAGGGACRFSLRKARAHMGQSTGDDLPDGKSLSTAH